MKTLKDFPDFVAAASKLTEVQAQHRAAEVERDQLLAAIEGARDRTESLSDQAQRLLSGDEGAVADLGTLREQHSRAGRRVALLAEVERQAKQRVEAERAAASREICEAVRPKFAALVLAELKAAHDLLAAQDRRRTFWQDLADAGVSMGSMPSLAPMVRATLNDQHSVFWTRAADAVELGYVSADAFKRPAQAPGGDNPMARPGLRLLAAGPDGVGLVETTGDGRTRPVPGQWHATPPKAANGWGDAA